MRNTQMLSTRRKGNSRRRALPSLSPLLLLFFASQATADLEPRQTASASGSMSASAPSSSSSGTSSSGGSSSSDDITIKITNNCGDTIWPAFATQSGTGPSTGGYELTPGSSQSSTVSHDWQGRIWGRTECSFNSDGTRASNLNGNNGGGQACGTGDCNGVLSCVVTGNTPVTLAEFDLRGGSDEKQTFYDISLVDGYNLPMGLTYIPGKGIDIPPNLTNCACVGTPGGVISSNSTSTKASDTNSTSSTNSTTSTNATSSTNSTYPIPYASGITNSDLSSWCPWDLQQNAPTKPGDGVYPYPDDNIQRPVFNPCLSACAKTNSPEDCCTGKYDSSSACKPNMYSTQAKAICPDAYSYAFDDSTSTFIIPSGGSWEVTFCPSGGSTNILKTFQQQLQEVAQSGKVSAQVLADLQNITIVMEGGAAGLAGDGLVKSERMGSLGALVIMVAWLCFW